MRGSFGGRRTFQVVQPRVEFPDELIELQGRFPDVEKQVATDARALDAALPVHCGVVSFVPGATAAEFSRSDLQTNTLAGNAPHRHPEFFAHYEVFE